MNPKKILYMNDDSFESAFYWCNIHQAMHLKTEYEKKGGECVKLTPKKIQKLEEGKHTGIIVKVDNRTEPYDYLDFHIKVDGSGIELRHGLPNNMSIDEDGTPNSKLAKFLSSMGFDVKKEVDTDKAVGIKLSFMTINKSTDAGEFANIVDGSIKKLS